MMWVPAIPPAPTGTASWMSRFAVTCPQLRRGPEQPVSGRRALSASFTADFCA